MASFLCSAMQGRVLTGIDEVRTSARVQQDLGFLRCILERFVICA